MLGRPGHYGARDRIGDEQEPDVIDFTKGALLCANSVTTVSPHHAWEARHTDRGRGPGRPLHLQQRKFSGIINGIGHEMWYPEIDPLIPAHFTAENLAGKAGNTKALRERLLLLRDTGRPIVVYVGRLDPQKSLHVIRHTLLWALANDAQFVPLVVFEHADYKGIESALRRALGLWRDAPAFFRELPAQGMLCDYPWRLPAQSCLDVYDFFRRR